MFDRVHLHTRVAPEFVPYCKTVKEIKAPTDDSIKLYEEIKEKAYKSILESISISDNVFKAEGYLYKDLLSFTTVFRYKISLNGVVIDGKEILRDENTEEIMPILYKKVSEHITKELLLNHTKRDV